MRTINVVQKKKIFSGNQSLENYTIDTAALEAARKAKMAAVKALEAKGGLLLIM